MEVFDIVDAWWWCSIRKKAQILKKLSTFWQIEAAEVKLEGQPRFHLRFEDPRANHIFQREMDVSNSAPQ